MYGTMNYYLNRNMYFLIPHIDKNIYSSGKIHTKLQQIYFTYILIAKNLTYIHNIMLQMAVNALEKFLIH